jgi:tetratricopeptide (TPR) repeat protein
VNSHEERLMDLALDEVVGGVTPPDLTERIVLAAATPDSVRPARRLAAVLLLAASLLVGAFVIWKIVTTPSPTTVAAVPPKVQERGAFERLAEELEKECGEGAADPRQRAEEFLKDTGRPETNQRNLFKAALCYRADAVGRQTRDPKDPEIPIAIALGEGALMRLLAQAADPGRDPLAGLAEYELGRFYLHEWSSQPDKALEYLERCEKRVAADDPWLARVLSAKIHAHLSLKRLDRAVEILDRLLEKFPDGIGVPRACKAVAMQLDDATAIRADLRRISKYYSNWVNWGPAHGLKITHADLVGAAETLDRAARIINDIGSNVISFVDLRGRKIDEPEFFANAAFVYDLLLTGPGRPAKDRVEFGTRRARNLAFAARDAKTWKAAVKGYSDLFDGIKFVAKTGLIDPALQQAHPQLIAVYLEFGLALRELGKVVPGDRAVIDQRTTVFSNVIRVVPGGTQPWWLGKYLILDALLERGTESDLRLAKAAFENLERTNPEFDRGEFGMKEKFLELRKRIDEAMKR